MKSEASIDPRRPTPLPANRGLAWRRAAPLDPLARASGALTHDLNNLLGVILSANERLAAELPQGGESQKLALLALEASERAADLLRRGLTAIREREAEAETVEAKAAMDSLRRIAREAVAPDVDLRVREPEPALRCAADRTGLEMALLNLCLNAGQATPDGGRIVVEARSTGLCETEAWRIGVAPGVYAAFSVRDTGVGMSPETLARATDPLFTTKSTGTGLGLSSIVDFAKSAGGGLLLRSRVGVGTTATLYLPIAASGGEAVAA